MKILYHHRTRAGDAQGVHIHEIVQAFRHLGHEVEIAALAGESPRATGRRATVGPARRSRRLPSWLYDILSLGYNLYGYLMLRRKARIFRPDLVYERYSLNTFCGVWTARHLRVPMILEVNAPLAQEQERLGQLTLRTLARHSERWICSNSTRTIVVSDAMRQLLVAEGVPPAKMAVVVNGVDPERFHPDIAGGLVRDRYGLHGKLVVGFVGWFRKWHGLERLLEAFRDGQLGARGACLLLVGDGPARRDLERLVVELGLETAVIFSGPVEHRDIPAYIAAMDIAVQPSAPEYACPMKIIEYMAMGRCVLAPDQANIREIVDDDRTGVLFTPDDTAALAKALGRAVDDPAARATLGRRAFETVASRQYFWTANALRALAMATEPPGRPPASNN
ncbi:MAG TPA: glycosyltransferase family 4 protein [Methylomirabilota bacterium]|nr:glycosyltransferase family 4 protein [Methylomirabilota bacterium]